MGQVELLGTGLGGKREGQHEEGTREKCPPPRVMHGPGKTFTRVMAGLDPASFTGPAVAPE
jgi:hypothetical protein